MSSNWGGSSHPGSAAADLTLSPGDHRHNGRDPHALRHTVGTALAEAGVGLAMLQALLGHARIDTTARYIHFAPARRRERANT